MCLVSEQGKLKRAKEDIVCYKYLDWTYVHNCLETPFQGVKISKRVAHGLKPFRAKGFVKKKKCVNCYFYEGGLIHAVANEPIGYKGDYVVFKCHIPKGTRYIDSNCDTTIAAKKIVFDELYFWPDYYKNFKSIYYEV